MRERKLPIGIQSFQNIRENNYLHVDKTKYIVRTPRSCSAKDMVSLVELKCSTPTFASYITMKITHREAYLALNYLHCKY